MHRMGDRRAILFVLCLAACGGDGGGSKKPIGPAIDEKTAIKDAKGLAQEILQTLGRGNKDGLFALLDDAVIVFGPRRAGVATTRTNALVALGEVIDAKAKKKVALRASALDVVASQGGRSAWAYSVLAIDGAPHAVTAILVNSGDVWQVNAALIAKMPPKPSIKAELAKTAVVPVGAGAKENIGANARGAVERFQKGLLDQESWGTDLASHPNAIVIGPGAGEVTRGTKDVKKLWKKRVELHTRAVIAGETTAAVTADGQLAWVSAPITRAADRESPIPLRAFAVFDRAGAGWRLAMLHESLAFDQPGSGASFTKSVPPVPSPEKQKDDKKVKKDDKKKAEPPKKAK
jgi:ketosteroid isomerase-like protein